MALASITLMLLMALAIYLVMAHRGQPLVVASSREWVKATGESLANALQARLTRIEGKTVALAELAASLPLDPALVTQSAPVLIDDHHDSAIAGGGIWPEPRAFDPNRERRSFFWARNAEGRLEFSDDYNQPSTSPYQQEPWYTSARDAAGNACVWSAAYRDPTTGVAMVTCSVPYQRDGRFAGVATLDLMLGGLGAFLDQQGGATGGYAFVVDAGHRVIHLPGIAQQGGELPTLEALAQSQAWLKPMIAGIEAAPAAGEVDLPSAGGLDRPVSVRWLRMENTGWTIGVVTPISRITALSHTLTINLLSIIVPLTGLLLLIGWLGGAGLLRRIRHTARSIESLGAGGRMEWLPIERRDEIGAVAVAVNGYTDRLKRLFAEIDQTAGSVASEAAQLTASNDELAGRTEQQTASLQQTSAAMEEIASTVQSNAANAAEVDRRVNDFNRMVRLGGERVDQLADSMRAINESSGKIAAIVDMIDNIAFQTNILALNASVEAARAGEQGRGFAVVAEEVRQLASRSATSAREINALIKQTGEQIETGDAHVRQVEASMAQIVEAIDEMNQRIREINQASAEQAQGVQEVNQTVSNLEEVTQQNAEMVNQTSAATQALADQAHHLKQLIAAFHQSSEKIGGKWSAPAARAPRRDHRALEAELGDAARLTVR